MTSFSEPVSFEYVDVEKLYTLIADAPREHNAVVCSIRKLSSSLLDPVQMHRISSM